MKVYTLHREADDRSTFHICGVFAEYATARAEGDELERLTGSTHLVHEFELQYHQGTDYQTE